VPWDPIHPKYYSKHTKYNAWEELAKAVDFWDNLADCSEILKRYSRAVYKLPIAKKLLCNCQSLDVQVIIDGMFNLVNFCMYIFVLS
jgi:hypothetical protein